MNKNTENKVRDFSEVKRIVIKIGTSNLTDAGYRLNPKKVERLTREIVELKKRGMGVIVVSSGAIGAGVGKLDLQKRPQKIVDLQATAAVGQSILMSSYDRYFAKYEQTIAQVLLTHEDFFDRRRSRNLRNTMITLLDYGVIPIVNENDTVAVGEIKLGDNDNLSALVATSLEADLLIMLTDIAGLYTYNPKKSKKAEFISVVNEITPEIERIAGIGRYLFSIGPNFKTDLGNSKISEGLKKVFKDNNCPLSSSVKISIVDNNEWKIRDKDKEYTIIVSGNQLNIYRRRKTKEGIGGIGGMKTKIQAAKVTMEAGIPMVIANGGEENILTRIIAGKPVGTLFIPKEKGRIKGGECWIRFFSLITGKIKVDEGAKTALVEGGGSLLPSGITDVEDEFMRGDPVSIIDARSVEFARGITNYSSAEIKKIKGVQSKEIEQILGRREYGYGEVVVYRGNLVLL